MIPPLGYNVTVAFCIVPDPMETQIMYKFYKLLNISGMPYQEKFPANTAS